MFTMKVKDVIVVLCLTLGVSGSQHQGHNVQVVDLTSDHTYQLNEAALEQILLREDVKDLPVVLVSVAGAYRGGKSFMLNFFLRYLLAPEETRNERGDWLGTENNTLAGFSWRGGAERHTTGILMWSEPFITTLPSGEKIAILLMDTQGTFDSKSTVRDCSTIFALSTLVSSVQIYNIKSNIKEDDLQHLQFFIQFGKSIKNENGTKAFQKLEFLIRDWQFEYDHAYGQKGGEELLAERLEVTEGMPGELRELRQHIRSSFESVTCFLMPHPGRYVGKKNFTGSLSEIDDEFKDALKELVPSIFAPSNLTVKQINGEKVKARDLFTYFKTYMEMFNSDQVPTVDTITKAASKAALLAAVRDAREQYEARMGRVSKAVQSLPSEALIDQHRRALAAAQATFSEKKTMASKNESDACLEQMTQEIEKQLPQLLSLNNAKLQMVIQEAKESYETAIHRVHGQNLLCLHPQDLQDIHNDAITAALTLFDAKRQQFPGVQDIERMKLIQILRERLNSLQNTNEQHNTMIVSSVQMEFSTVMEAYLSSSSPLNDDEFTAKYEEAKIKAISEFESKRNKPTQHEDDPYKASLLEAMSTQFSRLERLNSNNNQRALQRARDYYTNYMNKYWNSDSCCWHPDDVERAHKYAKTQALQIFHPNNDVSNDFKKQLLAQSFEYKYYNLKDQNTNCNDWAVRRALSKYVNYMDDKSKFTGWWIFVVPMLVNKANMGNYHWEAREVALQNFHNQRCNRNYAYDHFLWTLKQKIDSASGRYL